MKQINKSKLAVILAIIYTAIMGVGMYVMHYVQGYTYTEPEMTRSLIFTMIIITIFTLTVWFKFFKPYGLEKIDKRGLKSFLPFIIMIGILTILLIVNAKNLGNLDVELILIIGTTVLLVGISEELMYRGILLNSFLEKSSKIKAILLSSLFFSLLHLPNLLGGTQIAAQISQLINTFIMGLFFAVMAIKLKNIVPLMIYHGLWDFISFSQDESVLDVQLMIGSGDNVQNVFPMLALGLNFIMAIYAIIALRKYRKN